jgi:apolipoprotein D and lipocalin family protein
MTTSRMSSLVLVLPLMCLAVGCATTRIPPPALNRKVDLPRFMGSWYVVAGQFTWLERDAWNGIETYQLEADGTIATTYTFRKGAVDGPLKRYRPSAIVIDRESNAEWGMQFLWPFRATYLILFLDEDYRYTVIGEPDRKYLWIMARDPVIPDDMMTTITQRLSELGYDPGKFVRMPQQWPEPTPRQASAGHDDPAPSPGS